MNRELFSRRARRSFQPSWYSSSSSWRVAGCFTPCALRNWIARSDAWRRTEAHGVPRANWSEIAPMRPVWMLQESVIALTIGPDQNDVCELIGIGRMCRLWLPRQSPATIGHVAHGEVISPGAGQLPCANASRTGSSLPPYLKPFFV